MKWPDLRAWIARYRTFIKNFVKLMLVIFLITAALSVYIYENSRRIIVEELTHANMSVTQNVATSLDNLLESMRYITATLFTNDMVRFYIAADRPDVIFDGYLERVKDQLKAYVYAFHYIDSIYIYAPGMNRFMDSAEEQSIDLMRDTGWLEHLPESDQVVLVSRKMRDIYPYVISIINRTTINQRVGYIVVNVNLRRLPNILESSLSSNSDVYIITNESEVLYRKGQENINEPIADFSELAAFVPGASNVSHFSHSFSQPYVYSQVTSRDYDWHYVTVTYLHEYVSRLTSMRAVLLVLLACMLVLSCGLALLLSFSFYKPVRSLIGLLNDPENWDIDAQKSDDEIKVIAKRIVSYVQTNNRLSMELKNRLNVLNQTQIWALQSQINPHFISNTLNLIHLSITESMGYDHTASHMTIKLGRLMSAAMDSTNLISLREEIEYASLYIEILKKRYENRIEITFDIAPDTENEMVPKLILQPLIENAIHHGMRIEEDSPLRITVTSGLADAVCIEVRDDGKGISPEKLSKLQASIRDASVMPQAHIGLKNVATRLHLLYGSAFTIRFESEEGIYTSVRIRLPDTTAGTL